MSRPSRLTYSHVAILLHWLIALLILGLLALGYAMTRSDVDTSLQFELFQWHKSFGMVALALALIRALHWFFSARVSAIGSLSRAEKLASHAIHRLLLVLSILAPLAGWAVASVSTLGIPTFMFNLFVVPPLPMARSEESEALWSQIHATLAYTILFLVLIHALAAIYHHVWRRDEVLLRMIGRGNSIPTEKRP